MTGAGALIALATAGAAAGYQLFLPSPATPLDATVPLRGGGPPRPIQLPPGSRVANEQQVVTELLDDGTVVGIRVLQRLALSGTGDFFFQVPAPLRDVTSLPGSQAEPGLRSDGIVWQGFSAGRRILAADAELRPAQAGRFLPLRLELRSRATGPRRAIELRLKNTTAVQAQAYVADAPPAEVRSVLKRIPAQASADRGLPDLSVDVRGSVARRTVTVEAPLRVRGVIRLGRRVLARFERIVGGSAPARSTISVATTDAASPRPEVLLTVEPVPLLPELQTVRPGMTGRSLVLLAGRSLLRLARVHQYRAFLAAPTSGPARTIYRFRTVAPAALSEPAAPEEDGTGPLLVVLIAAGAAVLAAGGIVAWAHL